MRVTIKTKLAGAFGTILLLLAGAGYLAVSSLSGANDRMQDFAARPFAQVQRVGQFETMTIDGARILGRSVMESTDQGRIAQQTAFRMLDTKFQSLLKEYTELVPTKDQARVQPLQENWLKLSEIALRGFALAVQNNTNNANAVAAGDQSKAAQAMVDRLQALRSVPGLSVADARMADGIELLLSYGRRDVYRAIALTDDVLMTKLTKDFDERVKLTARNVGQLVEASRSNGFTAEGNAVAAAFTQWEVFARKAIDLGAANTDARAQDLYVGPFNQARQAVASEAAKLKAFEESIATGFVRDTQTSYEFTRSLTIGVVVGAIVLGLAG